MDIMQWLTENPFGELVYTFIMAMVPVVELRGAIPFGVSMLGREALPLIFIAAVLGNMVPVPFIIVYIKRIFLMIRKWSPKLDRLVTKLETTAHLKGRLVEKYKYLGLCILVAIPFPGTGAWTGALVAAFLDMRMKKALPIIFLGVVIAGIIVSILTGGFVAVFG